MRSGMAASLPLCSSMWTRPPSTVSPRRSNRRFCTCGSSTSNHFATAVPVNSRTARVAEPLKSNFKATSYSCIRVIKGGMLAVFFSTAGGLRGDRLWCHGCTPAHGFRTVTPQPSKPWTSRVATAAPREKAIAAICASKEQRLAVRWCGAPLQSARTLGRLARQRVGYDPQTLR